MNPLVALQRIRQDGIRISWERVRYRLGARSKRQKALRSLADRGRSGARVQEEFAHALGVPEDALLDPVLRLDAELCARGMPGSTAAETAQKLAEAMPELAEAVVARAESIARGDMQWLAPTLPNFEGPLDWHIALGGESPGSWPLLPVDEIEEAGEHAPGDMRLTWELNRHQFLPLLSMAGRFTGDGRHLDTLVDLLRHWMESNPLGKGIHWLHAQETALRMKAWIWARGLAGDAMPWTPSDQIRFHATLWAHADHAWTTRSISPDRNNHALTELLALDLHCAAMPSSPLAQRMGEAIHQATTEEILRQFWEDGAPGEGSIGYHLFTLESGAEWHAHRAALGLPTPQPVRDRLREMTRFAAAMIRPDGTWPRIGDVDDGRGFLLQPDPMDRIGAITAACGLFHVPPPLHPARSAPSFWLGAQEATSPPAEISESTHQTFVQAGLSVERTRQPACHLVHAAGPSESRPGVSLGHLHADGPSLTWWVDGHAILVDPGTGVYGGPLERRVEFRRTSSHSSIQIDAQDRFDIQSLRFGVERPPMASPVRFDSGEGWSIHESSIAASRSGSTRQISLTRSVVHLPTLPALVIIDRAVGPGCHSIWRHLHFGVQHLERDGARSTLRGPEGMTLFEVEAQGSPAIQRINAPRSPRYGVLERGEALRFEQKEAELPWSGALVLAPPGFDWDDALPDRWTLRLEQGVAAQIHLREGRVEKVTWEVPE